MEALFSVGRTYPTEIVNIMNAMTSKLRHGKNIEDTKCYEKNVEWVQKIYDGTFLQNQFLFQNESQYNLNGYVDVVRNCKGDWNKVLNVIEQSVNNLEMAKQPQYVPYNKTYLESITFSNFFEIFSRGKYGEINSPFLYFVNPPKLVSDYCSEYKLTDLKLLCDNKIAVEADKFCNKYFKGGREKRWFWKDIIDFSRWFSCLKENYPNIYSEMLSMCNDSNPFVDFKNYVVNLAKNNQGDNFVLSTFDFKIENGGFISGKFRQWLTSGIKSGKFDMLKYLDKPVVQYYSDESFKKSSEVKPNDKQVIDADDLVIF